MKFIRSLKVLICMALFAIGGMIIGMVVIPVSGFVLKGSGKRNFCIKTVKTTWILLIKLISFFKIANFNYIGNFNEIEGKVVVASHHSLLDIVILLTALPKSVGFAKKDILKNPCMHHIVKNLFIINDIDNSSMKEETQRAINEGFNIIIFPTGTRTLPNEEIKVHKGAAQIAINTNVDIVPITIDCDYPFLIKNHSPLDVGEKTINCKIEIRETIKISDYKMEISDEIKLRKRLSDEIKKRIS